MFDGKVPLWAYMPHLSSLPLTPSYLSKDVIGSYHESVHSLGSSANLPKPRLQIAKDFPSASPSQTRRIFSPGAVSEKREGKKKEKKREKRVILVESLNYREGYSCTIGSTVDVVDEGKIFYYCLWDSLVAQLVKNPPALWETWVRSLSWEDPLEKGMATHSSILAWRIPWTIWSMGSQKVVHN